MEREHSAPNADDRWVQEGPVREATKFLLDTESVSFALRGQVDVCEWLRERKPSELCISSITLAELRYGAERKGSRKLHILINSFGSSVEVAPFDEAAAAELGRIGSISAARGKPTGEFDILIAAPCSRAALHPGHQQRPALLQGPRPSC